MPSPSKKVIITTYASYSAIVYHRNATDLPRTLVECYQVFRPGGRIALYEYDHWGGGAGGHGEDEDDMAEVHRFWGVSVRALVNRPNNQAKRTV